MRRTLFLALIVLSALISQFLIPVAGNARLNLSLPVLLQFFLAGVFLADLYLAPPRFAQFGPRAGDMLALACSALMVYVLHWKAQLAWTEPLILVWFSLAIFRGAWTSRFFRLPLLTAAGAMSYTIYLYHFFVIRQLIPYTIGLFPPAHELWWDSGVQVALMLVPIFAISALVFVATERPFLILSHNMVRRLRRDSLPQQASPHIAGA